MNEVIMSGRLATDVTIRSTSNGANVANYRIAVEKRYKREGGPTADFFNCTVFGKGADFAGKYLKKGTKIIIRGELQNDNYQGRDGQMVYRDSILVQSHEFCESKGAESTRSAEATDTKTEAPSDGFMNIPDNLDEELPFA